MLDLRERIAGAGARIVAKIEKDVALENLPAILEAADCVMVARGDLGVELPFERVPVAQKRIIQHANMFHRPVITATQMLESMIAVAAMRRIITEIEGTRAVTEGPKYDVAAAEMKAELEAGIGVYPGRRKDPTDHAVAAVTVQASRLLEAAAIICLTRFGGSARLVSSFRPPVPVLGVTHDERTYRQLAIAWGVRPLLCPTEPTYEHMVGWARAWMLDHGIGS